METTQKSDTKRLRLGGGSAFFNDRLDAAVELVTAGNIDVLILETLAERTTAMLNVARHNGGKGYWEGMGARMETLLPELVRHGTRLVTNAGGADPLAAARRIAEIARDMGFDLSVAAVTGDDVLSLITDLDPLLAETGLPLSRLEAPLLAANAYLGSDAIAAAYAAGHDIIVTGRVTDSALALGPLMAEMGWSPDDMDAMACGIATGHLLECGGQATGGYFADPGMKDVPDLDRLGFPIAEVGADRSITITKPAGSGGRIDRHTITEQLLYEMHDPAHYITPDIVLDISAATLEETGENEVRLTGMRGKPRPDTLKVLVGVDTGMLAEIEMSYAGRNAEQRARLAVDILKKRFARTPVIRDVETRFDLIGIDSVWPGATADCSPREVRLRAAARLPDRKTADLMVCEVESLYVNGPAGGGGARIHVRPTMRTFTAFLPRDAVAQTWSSIEV